VRLELTNSQVGSLQPLQPVHHCLKLLHQAVRCLCCHAQAVQGLLCLVLVHPGWQPLRPTQQTQLQHSRNRSWRLKTCAALLLLLLWLKLAARCDRAALLLLLLLGAGGQELNSGLVLLLLLLLAPASTRLSVRSSCCP
jgi:hypothetical protein